MALNLLKPIDQGRGLLGTEKVTIAYTLFTAAVILLLWQSMSAPSRLIYGRMLVMLGMAVTFALYNFLPCRATLLLRHLYPLSLLAYWYPDTYEFCSVFPNLDHVFATADFRLFGCQPSLEFARTVPQKLWSELFNMGYFAYYPLIALTVITPFFTDKRVLGRTAFVVLTSFFLYYLIYLFLPVAGPQYYFHAIDPQSIATGQFPHIGDYFRYHTEIGGSPGPHGFFRSLVESTQESGERPTAAFPSSHVGMSTILMLLMWKNRNRRLLLFSLPFYVLLCCATVYIEAHYLVDVFGGLLSAVVFFKFTLWIYPKFGNMGLQLE